MPELKLLLDRGARCSTRTRTRTRTLVMSSFHVLTSTLVIISFHLMYESIVEPGARHVLVINPRNLA